MNIFAAAAGTALAFVAYKMYSESDVKPEVVLEKTSPLKDGRHFSQNSDANNISHVQNTSGLYGLPAWVVHYKDGTQTAKMYTPPTEINLNVGPKKDSRYANTKVVAKQTPPPITPNEKNAELKKKTESYNNSTGLLALYNKRKTFASPSSKKSEMVLSGIRVH